MRKKIFFLLMLLACCCSSIEASQIYDMYPLIKDSRNFKESKGGKSFGPQGRIIESTLQQFCLNKEKISDYEAGDKNWRYVVAMNCARNARPIVEILTEIQSKLISAQQQHRLAVVLGINEKVTVNNPIDYAPSWEDILKTKDTLATFKDIKIPVLLVYFQWTSFRENSNNKNLNPVEIRQGIFQHLNNIENERQYTVVFNKLLEEDKSHQFPFGAARKYLLQNKATLGFIADLHQSKCSVYTHIQDSDFVSYEEPLIFGDLQGNVPLISANQNRLLEKFDEVIAHHLKQNNRLPIIVGGAHVYSPGEDLSEYGRQLDKQYLNDIESKYFTRFTSEMGNNIKHIIGQQQPYGLYFHEPNSLVLSPISARFLIDKNDPIEWQLIYQRLAVSGFNFGIDSEMQDFTRNLFSDVSDNICRQGMVFSATTVLSTSMKSGAKPFTIKCHGNYNSRTKKFVNITENDLSAIRGMKQEIINPYKWLANIASSFNAHKVYDARKFISQALKFFDPIEILDPTNQESYSNTLVNYNALINDRKEGIRKLFHNLQGYYNKLGKGSDVALQIITAGWESGQVIRFMFLNHFESPANVIAPLLGENDQQIKLFLSERFNFKPRGQNPFVIELLSFNALPKEMPNKTVNKPKTNLAQPKIASVVSYLYEQKKGNKAVTAKLLGVEDPRRIDALMRGKSRSATWEPIAESLETPEKVSLFFLNKLNVEEINHIITLLFN